MQRKKWFFMLCTCLLSLTAAAQDNEFWFVAPDVASTHGDHPVVFVFSNPNSVAVDVLLEIWGGQTGAAAYSDSHNVPAGGAKVVQFSANDVHSKVENPNPYAGQKTKYGIHITTTNQEKILAYYMVLHESQRDLFSLKGKPALGTEFYATFQGTEEGPNNIRYYGQGVNNNNNYNMGADQIDIVATEDDTEVKVDLTKDCLNGISGGKLSASTSHTFTLNRGETLKLREDTIGDTNTYMAIAIKKNTGTLAGTKIKSDKPIAVTITEDCVQNAGAVDLLGDQIVPTDMAGTRYVVIGGFATYTDANPASAGIAHTKSSYGERIDFTSTGADSVTVHKKGGYVGHRFTKAGDTWHVNLEINANGLTTDTAVFVEATAPVYCYQRSAANQEMGAAIMPSMYSISQKQISFYNANSSKTNHIFLVFREGCESGFVFNYKKTDGTDTVMVSPTINPQDIPFPASVKSKNWKYARVALPEGITNSKDKIITVTNLLSPFSLGYFNDNKSSASYGYLSGFGSFKFDLDTMWSCVGSQGCETNCSETRPKFQTGLENAESWTWVRNDTDTLGKAYHDTTITADVGGKYKVIINQDPFTITDSCYVLDVVFDASMHRLPVKPAKVTVPQVFNVSYGPGKSLPSGEATSKSDPGVYYKWELTGDGGEIVSSDLNHVEIIWSTAGYKEVNLHMWATGVGCMQGGEKILRTCDTTLTYCVKVYPKHIGFFVDQQVDSGRAVAGPHDGTS
ncbi:MAG: hypothetical protein LBP50_08490, partial [Tannerella sp.]|nr:hypothetical protein [Tannerella sp.]